MIKNFNEVKKQLKDLSEVISLFKSEAVQLRIIELVFGLEEQDSDSNEEILGDVNTGGKKKKKKTKKRSKKAVSKEKSSAKKSPAGKGAIATLTKLVEGDFFKTPRTIKDIIGHCEVNLAKKIKQTEISGKLGRLVRDDVLSRIKNSDGQYEYKKT